MKIFNRDIRFDTFVHKGMKKIDDRFGVYFITGKQGSYKSYFAVYLALRQDRTIVNYIKTNIHSLKIPGIEIKYFNKITELYTDTDEHCIYIIDEVSRKYDKNSRTDTQFYAWLNQSRKRKRVVILITQEWKELPMWIRRPAKYMICTKPMFLLGKFGFLMTVVGDGENLVYNKEEGEYEAPPILYIYHKRNKRYADMYDTFEPINEL